MGDIDEATMRAIREAQGGSGRRRAAVNYAQEKVIDAAPEARRGFAASHRAGGGSGGGVTSVRGREAQRKAAHGGCEAPLARADHDV